VGLTTVAIGAILFFSTGYKKIARLVYDFGLGITILTLILLCWYFAI
jgi:hypothetical protein